MRIYKIISFTKKHTRKWVLKQQNQPNIHIENLSKIRMVVAAANLSRGGGFLLLSYLCRGGGGGGSGDGGISLRRNLATLSSFPIRKKGRQFRFTPLKAIFSNSNSNRISNSGVCFCTTSGSGPVTSNTVASDDDSVGGIIEDEEDKLKGLGNSLDIRVGQIIKIWRHEEADSLFVEEVDVGEPLPRIICSGLVKYIPLEHLQVPPTPLLCVIISVLCVFCC